MVLPPSPRELIELDLKLARQSKGYRGWDFETRVQNALRNVKLCVLRWVRERQRKQGVKPMWQQKLEQSWRRK